MKSTKEPKQQTHTQTLEGIQRFLFSAVGCLSQTVDGLGLRNGASEKDGLTVVMVPSSGC